MPRTLKNMFGGTTPFTPGTARNWLRSGGKQLTREQDAWLQDFLASGNRSYAFLRQDHFVNDLTRWMEVHSFAMVFTGDPLGMLRNHFFVTWDPPAGPPDTTQPASYLNIVEGLVIVGSQQFCLRFDNPVEPRDRADPEPLANVNFTAMRANDDPHRLDGPVITAGGSWWFTPVQTGCTVFIADWGGGNYSMTHLQPHYDESYGSAMGYLLEKSASLKTNFKAFALQTNVTAVVDQAPYVEPDRYILVQSNHTAESENVVVIGHRPGGAGAWRFYFQRYPRYRSGGPITASGVLEWNFWDIMRGYRPASLSK
jgi:hypothetical protein